MYTKELTQLSHQDLEAVIKFRRNSHFARQYLDSGIHPRTFPETLLRYSGLGDLESLRIALHQLENMKGEPGSNGVKKKVDKWLNNQSVPTNREQLVRICYVLHMSIENAQNFIATVGEGSLHYRNPVELTWLYGLKHGIDYAKMVEIQGLVSRIRYGGKGNTQVISEQFQQIESIEGYLRFVSRNADNLGVLHNESYDCFMKMLNLLIEPDGSYAGIQERAWTVRNVVRVYLHKPWGTSNLKEAVAKILNQNWPSETMISRIINRKIDVPRKVLILLYLTTNGGDNDVSISDDPNTLFEERYLRLNLMLNTCGYSQLDPRNAFDWLVLYVMYREEDEEISDRISELLSYQTATTSATK